MAKFLLGSELLFSGEYVMSAAIGCFKLNHNLTFRHVKSQAQSGSAVLKFHWRTCQHTLLSDVSPAVDLQSTGPFCLSFFMSDMI